MYIVTRFGKEVKSITPRGSYEKIRSEVRKVIRKNLERMRQQMENRQHSDRKAFSAYMTFVDGEVDHRNPSLQAYGFKIVKI